jgi:acetyltransferase-like isoleucine patch superfamily enzyme
MDRPTATVRHHVASYVRTLDGRRRVALWLEDWLGVLVRSCPGAIGYGLRWLLARALFARLDGPCFLYAGARLIHCYGIRAGSNLRINSGAFIDARGGLTIGSDVLIGPNVVIVTSEHQWNDASLPIVMQGHRPAPVEIGDDVWIGANATLMPGVRVASGTVVAAGAVVTTDTMPYAIVAGVPARRIGERPRPEP